MKRIMLTSLYFSTLFFGPSLLVLMFSMFLSAVFGIPPQWGPEGGTKDIRAGVSGFITFFSTVIGVGAYFVNDWWNEWGDE